MHACITYPWCACVTSRSVCRSSVVGRRIAACVRALVDTTRLLSRMLWFVSGHLYLITSDASCSDETNVTFVSHFILQSLPFCAFIRCRYASLHVKTAACYVRTSYGMLASVSSMQVPGLTWLTVLLLLTLPFFPRGWSLAGNLFWIWRRGPAGMSLIGWCNERNVLHHRYSHNRHMHEQVRTYVYATQSLS